MLRTLCRIYILRITEVYIYIYIASIEWSLHRYEQQLWRFGFPQLHDQLPWFSSLLVYSCELCIRSFMMNHWNCFLGTLQPFVGSRFVRPPMLPRSLFCKAPWYGEVVGSWWMSYLNPHKVLVATCWDVKVRKELRHHLLQFLEDLFKDIFLAFSCYTYHCSTKATCDAVMHMPRRRYSFYSFWPVVCFWYSIFADAFNVVETGTGAGQRSAYAGFKRKHILQGRKHRRPDRDS